MYSASGSHHLQQFDDLRYLLRQLENKETAEFGKNSFNIFIDTELFFGQNYYFYQTHTWKGALKMNFIYSVIWTLTGEQCKHLQSLRSLQYSVILRQLSIVENAGQEKYHRQASLPAEFGDSHGEFMLLKIKIYHLYMNFEFCHDYDIWNACVLIYPMHLIMISL